MRTRGRRSSAEQAVVVTGNFGRRPDPPVELTAPQADIWREVVASESPDFFDTAALRGLLTGYCQHRDAGDKLSEVINAFPTAWLNNGQALKRYQQLLRMRDLEVQAAARLATKLRLTNQARFTAKSAATAAARAAKGKKPWET